MSKNQIQRGENIDVTAPYAVVSGAGCLVGVLFGIAIGDIANGADGVICTEGVFSIAATSANTGTVGAVMYWDDTGKEATTTAASNYLIGVLTKAKAGGETVAEIRLNGVSVAVTA